MRPSREYIKKAKIANLSEAIESMRDGNWFYVYGMDNYDWYYRIEQMPITNMKGEKGYLVRRVNMTSARTTFRSYYWFLDDSDGEKILIGEDLKTFIEKQVKMWIKQLNVNKMTAFSGKRYASFLNAIPKEVLQEDGFSEKLIKIITQEVDKRKAKEQDELEKQKLELCKASSAIILHERAKGQSKHVNGNSSAVKAFEDFSK